MLHLVFVNLSRVSHSIVHLTISGTTYEDRIFSLPLIKIERILEKEFSVIDEYLPKFNAILLQFKY